MKIIAYNEYSWSGSSVQYVLWRRKSVNTKRGSHIYWNTRVHKNIGEKICSKVSLLWWNIKKIVWTNMNRYFSQHKPLEALVTRVYSSRITLWHRETKNNISICLTLRKPIRLKLRSLRSKLYCTMKQLCKLQIGRLYRETCSSVDQRELNP